MGFCRRLRRTREPHEQCTVRVLFSRLRPAGSASAAFIVSMLLILGMLPTASAQVVTGTISGRVVDPFGGAVPGASVTITDRGTAAELTATTKDSGSFRFTLLPVGIYDVQISKSGFKTLKLAGVAAQANFENAVGDVKLEIGAESAMVQVTAAPPLIEATTAQITTVFEGETLQTFPGIEENQGLDYVALQLPGVGNSRDLNFPDENGADFSVNGLTERQNDQQIDGQNNNDNSTTGPSIDFGNVDFLEEYDITTDNFGPEFGRNSGSVVNEVTKSGTNNWHGTASGTETNSVLTSLDNFETAPLKVPPLTKPPRFNEEFTSGTIGGPIWKDKVFFFGGFNDLIDSSNSVFSTGALTPTPSGETELASCFPGSTSVAALKVFGPFGVSGGNPTVASGTTTTAYFDNPPAPNTLDPNPGPNFGDPACGYELGGVSRTLPNGEHRWDWIDRVDVHVSSADTFFVRILFQKQAFFNIFGSQTSGYPVNLASFSGEYLAAWTHIFSNRLVNEFRVSYGRNNFQFGGNTIGNTVPEPGLVGSALTDVAFAQSSLLPFGPESSFPQGRIVNTYQAQDNLDYTVGRHQMKMGGSITLQKSPFTALPNFNGVFTYSDWGSFAANGLSPSDPNFVPPASVSITQGNPRSDFKEWDTFLYFGDDWKVKDNLTLNLGLTWSYYGQPANLLHQMSLAQQTGPNPFWDPALPLSATTSPELSSVKDLFGPGIGFAWSPNFGRLTGGARTVIRGGYRLAYDPAYYNTFILAQISAPIVLSQTLIMPAAALPAAPFGPAIRSEFAPDLTEGVFDPRNFDRTAIPKNFRPDRVHEWSLGIQRQVTTNSVFEVRYVGNHGSDLFQSINANPFIAGLAAEFPALVPAGVTPCTAPISTVPNAAGRVSCSQGVTNESANTGFSNYNALQAQFRASNLAHQLTLITSYTWSKTLDNVSDIFGTYAAGNTVAYSQNVLNFKGQEYGVSGLDFPHTWTLSFVEDIPFMRSQHGVAGHILGGWGIAGSYVLQSGQGFTPSQEFTNVFSGGAANDTAFDLANIGIFETSRPFVGSMSAPQTQVGIYAGDACAVFGAACGDPAGELISLNSLNAAATVVPVAKGAVRFIANGAEADTIFGTPFGNAGRNSVRDRWTNVGNFELFKNAKLSERVNLQWHMTINNVFNHPQFGALPPGIDPFAEDAGFASPGVGFANPLIQRTASNDCPAGVRCVFFGLKITY